MQLMVLFFKAIAKKKSKLGLPRQPLRFYRTLY
jgi:hypothetical protein